MALELPQLQDLDVIRSVPDAVLAELGLSVLLGVCWRLDLRRQFLPLLSATVPRVTVSELRYSRCQVS